MALPDSKTGKLYHCDGRPCPPYIRARRGYPLQCRPATASENQLENYFNNDLNIIAVREGIRFSYDVLKNGEGFKDIILDEYPWEMPLHDDDLMKRTVLDRCQTSFHPCGTTRLSKDVQQDVVDSNLKVHGNKSLRVIDASVIPVIPDCRIQNSVYMVAEKGDDAIKRDHVNSYQ